MNVDVMFFVNSTLLGAGLAMDAFSVSLANGLNEVSMKKSRMCGIAGTFSFFQFAMPMIGWICVTTVVQYFKAFEQCIPWIALLLLGFIGGKMLLEGIRHRDTESEQPAVNVAGLLLQGLATSIDAFSVGFTISDHRLPEALLCCAIIALVTFILCVLGLAIGKKAGTKLAGKAGILGGSILLFIGLEIFISHWF